MKVYLHYHEKPQQNKHPQLFAYDPETEYHNIVRWEQFES